jgi:hypothetical protein
MPIFAIILTLIVVGVLLWLFNTKVTIIDATIKQIINIIVIVVVIVWLLQAFGIWQYLFSITV